MFRSHEEIKKPGFQWKPMVKNIREIIDILVFVDAIGETAQVQQKRARSNDRL